ncbi:MAG TPA: hypothetical protein VI027_08510 [Rubrobacteraceae bacterium]
MRLFFVGQLLLSSGVFCERLLLLLEDQAHPEDYSEDFLAKRRNRHRYALGLMITYR